MLIHKMSLCDVYVNNNDDDDESQADKKNVEEKKIFYVNYEKLCAVPHTQDSIDLNGNIIIIYE